MENSFYEMTDAEVAEYSPQDFTEAYIKTHARLVEEWRKTVWLNPNGRGGKIHGEDQRERDLNEARIARLLQNTVDYYFPPTRGSDGSVRHVNASEMVEKLSKNLPDNGKLPESSLELGEAASANTTSAWSGATLLPMVLGYARKIMPKLYGQQFYQVQPLDRPGGRVFFVTRTRDNNGTTDGQVEQRAGWSYRSWITDPGEGSSITKASTFAISSADIPAPKSRKIQTETTIEVEQDLRAWFGWDAVALVSEVATDEMAVEIDEELVYNLYNRGSVNGIGTFQYGLNVPTMYQYDPSAYDKRVLELITRAGLNMYHQKRVMPNWFISGTDWQLLLANLSLYQSNTSGELNFTSFLNPSGTLKIGGGITHYVASKPFPISEGIMGYKGKDYVDGSAFFLPYIPLQLTGMLFDPNTQKRKLSWITRYSIYNHAWSGLAENYAYLKTNATMSGLSYPSAVEYV